jgi:hypothetical protein
LNTHSVNAFLCHGQGEARISRARNNQSGRKLCCSDNQIAGPGSAGAI